jgi:carbon-monoxide dehydrogenase medium subunit
MRLFAYHRPGSVQEAVELLADLGDEAALLAGGTSVMNMARLGLAEPEHVVALTGVDELRRLDGSQRDGLTLGAMASLREIETSELVRRLAPGLSEAAGHVATVRIRNQATVGGNLVHADPNQDLPPMLIVHEAVARLTGPAGSREVPVSDLFVGYLETVVEPDEVLDTVRVPPVAEGVRTGYLKFLPRTQDDYPTIAVAAAVTVVEGRIGHARIAVAGGASTAVRCRTAEAAVVGCGADGGSLMAAADTVREALEPASDGRGSGRYKAEMARVCTQRLLHRLLMEGPA